MKKIIIAIDSFKGCLTSAEAGKAAEKGIKSINPSCHTSVIPIADGGEGLLDVLITATKGKYITLSAHGPLMKMAKTHYGLSGNGRTAIIEMAAISGLPLVPIEQRNPMLTTTFGTGELIKDALNKGCRNFIIGIGGSATNDAGLGMLQALGFRFLDKSGHTLGTGGQIMEAVANIDTSGIHPALRETHFMVACDVANPFYGPDGAAYIFAQQKGADSNMVQRLDEGMQSLAEVIKKTTGKDITNYPGAGSLRIFSHHIKIAASPRTWQFISQAIIINPANDSLNCLGISAGIQRLVQLPAFTNQTPHFIEIPTLNGFVQVKSMPLHTAKYRQMLCGVEEHATHDFS